MSSLDYLKFDLFPEEAHWGDWCAKPQAYFRGETSLPGAKFHVGFQVFVGDTVMEVPHFHHAVEEYMILLGANFPNVFDFDAEVRIEMGKDPDHMETMVITKPCVLRIPPNMWHCPVVFKIRKPLIFQAAYLDGTWSKILRRPKADGTYEYLYEGDNIRYCKERPGEFCTLCGKCFGEVSDRSATKA